jgi:hypothetical protein
VPPLKFNGNTPDREFETFASNDTAGIYFGDLESALFAWLLACALNIQSAFTAQFAEPGFWIDLRQAAISPAQRNWTAAMAASFLG